MKIQNCFAILSQYLKTKTFKETLVLFRELASYLFIVIKFMLNQNSNN